LQVKELVGSDPIKSTTQIAIIPFEVYGQVWYHEQSDPTFIPAD
jgi:hypothetical protein